MAASMATRKRNTSARYVTHYAILYAMLTLQLLYIYILGWNVDFGHLEAVNLISATKYSEKQIGYLAVTLFLHEEHELIHLVVNSIRKDLLDHNELNNCLALHAIANVGGKELGEALSAEVHRLLISPLVVIERGQWLS
jgi:AP-2 complex subunit alpha